MVQLVIMTGTFIVTLVNSLVVVLLVVVVAVVTALVFLFCVFVQSQLALFTA